MEKSIKEKIIEEAKRIEEDSLYSAKGHFYAGQFWVNIHLWIGVPAAILAAIAGASALSQFDYHNVIAGVLSIMVAALTAVATFLNPNEKANMHQVAGNNYNSLRNRARIFSEIEIENITDEKLLVKELKGLNSERDKLNKESPQIPRWAYKKARRGIKEGEASYRVDN